MVNTLSKGKVMDVPLNSTYMNGSNFYDRTPTSVRFAQSGTGITISGDSINIGSPTFLYTLNASGISFSGTSFTINTWAKIPHQAVNSTIFSRSKTTADKGLWIHKRRNGLDSSLSVQWAANSGSAVTGSPVAFPDNTWEMATFSWNKTDGYAYLYQGVTIVKSGIFNSLQADSTNIMIGATQDFANQGSGTFSNLRIYSRVLEQSEINLLYEQGRNEINLNTGNLYKGLIIDLPLTSDWVRNGSVVVNKTPYVGARTWFAKSGTSSPTFDKDGVNILGGSSWVGIGSGDNWNNGSYIKDITVAFWTCPGSSAGTKTFSHRGWGDSWEFTAGNDNRITFRCLDMAGSACQAVWPGGGFSNGSWAHIVGTYSSIGSEVKIFYNGSQMYVSGTYGKGIRFYGDEIGIGNARQDSGRPFTGSIAYYKMWNRALTGSEVQLLYDKGKQ